MTSRSLISRREPVITLETLRYRGRNYKEGDHLDRRRTRMPHSKLVRLIREGVCSLAKDLSEEKLKEYGYKYDPTLRYHLTGYVEIEEETSEEEETTEETTEETVEETTEEETVEETPKEEAVEENSNDELTEESSGE